VAANNLKTITSTIISVITEDLGYPVKLDESSVISDVYMDSLDTELFRSMLEGIYRITIDDSIYTDRSTRISDLANYIQNKLYVKGGIKEN
jgi:acyl carrier protein